MRIVMRKVITLLLSIVLVFSSLSVIVSADQASDSASKSKTDRRNIFEFLELAANRLTLYAENIGYDSRKCLSPFSGMTFQYETEYTVVSSLGNLDVSKEDNTIISAVLMAVNTEKQPLSLTGELYTCIAAISALEYDARADSIFSLQYSIGLSTSENAIDEAAKVFQNEMLIKLTDPASVITKKNTPVLVYSGNYDYYVEYTDFDDSLLFSISAKAR